MLSDEAQGLRNLTRSQAIIVRHSDVGFQPELGLAVGVLDMHVEPRPLTPHPCSPTIARRTESRNDLPSRTTRLRSWPSAIAARHTNCFDPGYMSNRQRLLWSALGCLLALLAARDAAAAEFKASDVKEALSLAGPGTVAVIEIAGFQPTAESTRSLTRLVEQAGRGVVSLRSAREGALGAPASITAACASARARVLISVETRTGLGSAVTFARIWQSDGTYVGAIRGQGDWGPRRMTGALLLAVGPPSMVYGYFWLVSQAFCALSLLDQAPPCGPSSADKYAGPLMLGGLAASLIGAVFMMPNRIPPRATSSEVSPGTSAFVVPFTEPNTMGLAVVGRF